MACCYRNQTLKLFLLFIIFGILIGESVKIWKEAVVTSANTILTTAGRY